jgi:ribonuclease BN (tRNA processing enzyme)
VYEVKITILGSGTGVPSQKRGSPGYLLYIGNETLLIDGGSGTLRQIASIKRSIWEISKVFYSHFHIDHINDLLPLLFAYKYFNNSKISCGNITIYAHPDLKYYLRPLTEIYEEMIYNKVHPFIFKELVSSKYIFNGYEIKIFKAFHTPQSLIFRFQDSNGKVLTYTGDTDYCNELVESSRNADLLVIECSFPDRMNVKGHMSPSKILKVIDQASPKKVLLTHIYPENDTDEMRDKFSNLPYVDIAEDLLEVNI